MIQLHSDFLAIGEKNSEAFLYSVQQLGAELMGEKNSYIDPEVLLHATQAILFYFKHELRRTTVTLGEFAAALATVLRTLGIPLANDEADPRTATIAESNLPSLIDASSAIYELAFFRALRAELRRKINAMPQVLRFTGLHECVRSLTGKKRWTKTCQNLENHILWFVRHCYRLEAGKTACLLVIQ